MKLLLGSHSTGKTTLLEEVSKKFPNYYVTDGFSRPVLRISNMLDLSSTERQIILNELSTWAYENHIKHSNVISTRSIIDCIIYTQILNPEIEVDQMIELFQETQNKVEYFFYLPVEFPFAEDPERLSYELQLKVDNIIKDFIAAFIPAEKLITVKGTLEERLDIISNYL